MSTRCVVNVVTGVVTTEAKFYLRGQDRLRLGVEKFGSANFKSWKDPLPSDWPAHKDVPYGFKVMALKNAAKDHDLVLWCDSSIVPISSMEPLWERIERAGYFLVNSGEFSNYQWTADSAYAALFPGVPIEEARKLNRAIPQVVGGVIGLNVKSKIGTDFLDAYYALSQTNAFCGPWANSDCPEHPIYSEGGRYTTASCGPDDVRGHRHDQCALSVIASRMKLKFAKYPAPYAYNIAGEGTILLHDGPGLVEPEKKKPVEARHAPSSGVHCPSCASEAIGMAGGMRRCNQCGYQF